MELYTVTSSPMPTNIVSETRDMKSSICGRMSGSGDPSARRKSVRAMERSVPPISITSSYGSRTVLLASRWTKASIGSAPISLGSWLRFLQSLVPAVSIVVSMGVRGSSSMSLI